jgi:AcrR family transcriptional regulator
MARSRGTGRGNPEIRQQAARMNRELVMDTAARLFSESSYDAVSIDDIADRIGATKGLIYHYFPSKSALLGEFLLWNHDLFLNVVNPAWDAQGMEPDERLRKVIRAHMDFYFEYSYMLIVVFRTAHLVPPEMRRRIRRLRESYTRKFRTLVEEVQEAGRMVAGDSDVLTTSIITLTNYLAYHYMDARSEQREELFRLVCSLFLR